MSVYNICFYGELKKLSQNCHLVHLLMKFSDTSVPVFFFLFFFKFKFLYK